MPELTDVGMVRLLIAQPAGNAQAGNFTDTEIAGFLALEGGSIKRAAAQALDAIASNEALRSKDITDSDGKHVNGPTVAAACRAHATALRTQAADEDGFVEIIDPIGMPTPELTEGPRSPYAWPFW